jgi:hypothetical protein
VRLPATLLKRVWAALRGSTTLKQLIAPDHWSTWQDGDDEKVPGSLAEPLKEADEKPAGRCG